MSSNLGNRHQGDLDGKLLEPTGSGRVRVAAGASFASTQAGQHLLWMLVNLLARQYGVVTEIQISVPSVAVRVLTALFGNGATLDSVLIDVAETVAAGQIEVRAVSSREEHGYVWVECVDIPNSCWAAAADGWSIYVAPHKVAEVAPQSSLSIGPYFAASILASEVFKTLRGYDPSRRRNTPLYMSLWTFDAYGSPGEVPSGPTEISEMALPYLVGAGAVGQALAATFISSRIGPPQIIVLDDDAIDDELTNLNRYCLSVHSDRGRNKAKLVADYFDRVDIKAFPSPLTWADYVQSGPHDNLPFGIRSAERGSRYEYLISCVDKNAGRHDLQKMWPRLIVGGSTHGMSATVQIYDLGGEQECLMCSNPLEVDGWTLEGELLRLKQLSDTECKAEALRVGIDPELLVAHVRDPRCGTLGEAELRRFKPSANRHDWSVGFVSVGAGVMLGAVLLRWFSERPTKDEPHAYRFSFETNQPGKSRHKPDSECECQQRGGEYWRRLWS